MIGSSLLHTHSGQAQQTTGASLVTDSTLIPVAHWSQYEPEQTMPSHNTPPWRHRDGPANTWHNTNYPLTPAPHWSRSQYEPGRAMANHSTPSWRHRDGQSQPVSKYARHPTAPRYGCYNCGEHNHRLATCRYDHRLRCGNCHRLGHKERVCQLPVA